MVAVPVWGLFVLAVIFTLYYAGDILVPLLVAVMLSIVLGGPVNRLRRLGLPVPVGAALVVFVMLGLVVLGVYRLSGPAEEWVSRGPQVLQEMRVKLSTLRESIQTAQEVTEQLSEVTDVATQGADAPQTVVVEGPSLIDQLFTGARAVVLYVFTTLVLIFFLLGWGRQLLEGIIRAMPDAERAERLANLLRGIGREVAAYLGTIAVIDIAVGVVTAVVMWLLGLPSPALWGVVAGILNFIPYIGPLIMMAILGTVALLTFNTLGEIVMPPFAFLVINILEGEIITPAILGRRLTLNPILVFLSVLVWGAIWGVAGTFLAVPILAAFKATCDHVERLGRLRAVLGVAQPGAAAEGLPEAANGSIVRRLFAALRPR